MKRYEMGGVCYGVYAIGRVRLVEFRSGCGRG